MVRLQDVMTTASKAPYAPGVVTPRPRYIPDIQLGQQALHRRIQHPKMKRRQCTENNESTTDHAMTLRNARFSNPFGNVAFEESLAADSWRDGVEEPNVNPGTSLAQLSVPTAEDVHGREVAHHHPPRHPQKEFLPHPYEPWAGLRSTTAALQRPSTAQEQHSTPNTRRFEERLYRRDVAPSVEAVEEALCRMSSKAKLEAQPPAPFYSSVPAAIPPLDRNNNPHKALLDAVEKDRVCRAIQQSEERRLVIKARIQCGMTKPPSTSRPSSSTFPISARLARMQRRLQGHTDAKLPGAVVKEFVHPSFVLPSSRRYGSNKYQEAPKPQMAYEADEDDFDALLAMKKFEKTVHRKM